MSKEEILEMEREFEREREKEYDIYLDELIIHYKNMIKKVKETPAEYFKGMEYHNYNLNYYKSGELEFGEVDGSNVISIPNCPIKTHLIDKLKREMDGI